ncbi:MULTISPECIES: putative quinol monooxygenase [unclassified Paenibacillus]|uniref:putative quinol monooxygenase n=1 Tax=unclassified Paenibacillus TaxID=185978 RepID=UPI00210CD56A|nr:MULTISPECIES: antibiotic biosynthesis monooxygenase [unclassified Paenibacillus]
MNVKFTAQPGQREALADILLEAAELARPDRDCELYIVHVSDTEPDTIWVNEVWSSKDAHDAALALEETRASIQRAMPLIAGVEAISLLPLGGKGL